MEIATEIAGESFGVGGELDRIDLCGGHHHKATESSIDIDRFSRHSIDVSLKAPPGAGIYHIWVW